MPNVRVCVEPLREGARRPAQNVVGSLEFDVLGVVDKLGGPFTPVGFYYKTMIRPRRAWPLYERFLRNVAGLGRVDPSATRRTRATTSSIAASTCWSSAAARRATARRPRPTAAGGNPSSLVDTMPRPSRARPTR